MDPTSDAYHVDWIFSKNSNVHVAKHRDWFTIFTEFKSKLADGQEVLGVGDAELEVKTHLKRKGSKSHRTLVLKDVLLVPSCVCNVLGGPILDEYGVTFGDDCGLKDSKTGGSKGLFDRVKLMKLWLVGHHKGDTSLDRDMMYWILVQWPENERMKWRFYKKVGAGLSNDDKASSQKTSKKSGDLNKPKAAGSEYTAAEKAWLKRAFGGEFKFLRVYGLKFHKDEDREEGRAIARGIIEQEAADDDSIGDPEDRENDDDDESENSFLADLEADPASHLADRHFTEEQLDWIKKHYLYSGNFLRTHGLKPFDDEDCKKGVAIAKAFMKDDE